MYCSSCGVAVAQNLTYCNHCGAKINSDKADSRASSTEVRSELATMWAMVGLFVFGLVAIALMLGMMKEVIRFNDGQVLTFAILGFLALMGLEGVFISRLFRRRRDPEATVDAAQFGKHITKELAADSRIISEPTGSVTDHTTRTLNPVYEQRK